MSYSNKNHKILHYFFWINMPIIFLGCLLITYLAFFQGSNPIILKNEIVQTVQDYYDQEGNYVAKDTFYTGEQLTYAFEFCKNTNVSAKMYGSYYDTVKIDMPVIEINSSTGCQKRINDYYKIPKILPSGKYHFEVELVYQVNPLREVSVRYKTQDFKIINK